MKFTVGICAYNEEENIGQLIENILRHRHQHELAQVLIVSSGSTDRTDKIVTRWAKKDNRVRLVVEAERKGKWSGINQVFKNCPTKILVMTDADCLLVEGAIDSLLARFSKKVGVVAGRTVPLNDPESGFWGYAAHFRYQLFHLGAVISSDQGTYSHLSGYLYAIRTGIVKRLPPLICDDLYVGVQVKKRGYGIVYEPRAKVNILHPTRLIDFLHQRRNIRLGHHQIEQLTGHRAPSTVPLYVIPLVLVAWSSIGGGLKKFGYTVLVASLEQLAAFWALLMFKRKQIPLKWHRINSSKRLVE